MVDMKMLPETAAQVHHEFRVNIPHAVSRSKSQAAVNRATPDMALEQSVENDSKSKGGIVGLSASPITRSVVTDVSLERRSNNGIMIQEYVWYAD